MKVIKVKNYDEVSAEAFKGNPCLILFRMWKDKGFHKDYLPGICSEQIQ